MMDAVFGLLDEREDAFICALQQQQQSRLPSASRKEQSSCRRACHQRYEMTKTMGLQVKTGRQFLQLFSHLLSLDCLFLVQ
jgi:hypothetical protein